MPRFLIHVGPHKTGTTYLQLVFAAARQRLLERGVLFPTGWSMSETVPSHWNLFRQLREGDRAGLGEQFDLIMRSGAQSVLISAEDINHLNAEELEVLRSAIQGHPATIIFYCRRWSELLPSLWQERVKHGYDESFPEFFAQNVSNPFHSAAMNFSLPLSRYAHVFGAANIRCVSYSNVCDENRDLAEHFFETFLPECRSVLDGLLPIANPRPNRSLQASDIEVIRMLNAFRAVAGGPRDAMLRVWYQRENGRFDLSGLHAAISRNIGTLSFSDASPATELLQHAILAAYGHRLVAPTSQGALFAARTNNLAFAHSAYLAIGAVRRWRELYTGFVADGDAR